MKFWLFLTVFLCLVSSGEVFGNQFQLLPNEKLYHVEVHTSKGIYKFAIKAETDFQAHDSALVGAVYSKKLGIPSKVKVTETGLASYDLPEKTFEVISEYHTYFLRLKVASPEYVMTAIQASKFIMSNSTVRDIFSVHTREMLKARPAVKFTVKSRSKEVSYLMNTNDVNEARIALDIAATMSKRVPDYLTTYPTSRKVAPPVRVKCVSVFAQ